MTIRARRMVTAVAVVAALGSPRLAGAQDTRVYVGGAGMLSVQGSHRQGSGPSLPTTGAGGTVIGGTGRVQVAVVGGGGFVQESTRQRRRDQVGLLPTFPPVFGPYSEEYSFTRWTAAALAGADVEIAIGRHVALVPQMRVHFVRRTSDPSRPGWALGLSSVIVRPAIGVRAVF